MDLPCDCAEPPTAVGEQPLPPPPSSKLNKAAFKLFKRRKSGGAAMPSIFGVRGGGKGRSGESGGGGGQAGGGMVRSKTHDGLAEALLETSGKEEEEEEDGGPPRGGGGGGGGVAGGGVGGGPGDEGPSPASSSSSAAAAAAAAAAGKPPSFFSLWRKAGGGERQKGRGGGLKGLFFGSLRWPRRDKAGAAAAGAREDEATSESSGGSQSSPSLPLRPGSLTASLECIKEELLPRPRPRPAPEATPSSPPPPPGEGQPLPPKAATDHDDEEEEEEAALGTRPAEKQQDADGQQHPPPIMPCGGGEAPPRIQPSQAGEPPEGSGHLETQEEDPAAITGCGDIIADQEEDVGSSGGGGGSDKSTPGVSKSGATKKPPSVVTYQGGGEEMASPEQVGDMTSFLWDVLSQMEKSPEMPGATESPKTSKDGSCAKRVPDRSTTGKPIGLNQTSVHQNHKQDQKSRDKEQPEAVPSSDEGYWDSTTPGPEEDNTGSRQKEAIPRDSYSGDALYDLYADPEENAAAVTSAEDTSVTCCKTLSSVATTCPIKPHTTSLKDSKIPISIKHFTSPHGSHGPDTSNSHHIIHQQPTKSEIPRTKIPVSKVLVHRASYRSLAGTVTGKAATYHESAKK